MYPTGKLAVAPHAVVLPFLLSLALPQTSACHGRGCVQGDWSVRPRGTHPPGSGGYVWNPPLNTGVPRNDPKAFDQFRQCTACNSAGTWWHRLHQPQYSWIVPLAEHLRWRWWPLPSFPWSHMCGTGVYGKEKFPLVWLGHHQRETTKCYEPWCLGDLYPADKRTKAWCWTLSNLGFCNQTLRFEAWPNLHINACRALCVYIFWNPNWA